MTKEEFKACVYEAFHNNEHWEQFLECVGELYLQAAPHWISVEDELPPNTNNGGFSDEVWTYNLATNQRVVAQFNYISNCWFGCDDTVTHWMPLPEPPKKGGEQ